VILELVDEAVGAGARLEVVRETMGLSASTVQRWQALDTAHDGPAPEDPWADLHRDGLLHREGVRLQRRLLFAKAGPLASDVRFRLAVWAVVRALVPALRGVGRERSVDLQVCRQHLIHGGDNRVGQLDRGHHVEGVNGIPVGRKQRRRNLLAQRLCACQERFAALHAGQVGGALRGGSIASDVLRVCRRPVSMEVDTRRRLCPHDNRRRISAQPFDARGNLIGFALRGVGRVALVLLGRQRGFTGVPLLDHVGQLVGD